MTWTSSFVPLDPVNNDMFITANVPAKEDTNDNTGFGLRIQLAGTGTVYDFQGYGSEYAGMSSGSLTQTLQSYAFVVPAGTISAGTYELHHRTYTADSNAILNPNSSDDSRLNQTRSTLLIMEYKN